VDVEQDARTLAHPSAPGSGRRGPGSGRDPGLVRLAQSLPVRPRQARSRSAMRRLPKAPIDDVGRQRPPSWNSGRRRPFVVVRSWDPQAYAQTMVLDILPRIGGAPLGDGAAEQF